MLKDRQLEIKYLDVLEHAKNISQDERRDDDRQHLHRSCTPKNDTRNL